MVYIWDTSIPDKWKKIAGEDHFIHISKSNRAKNTLEFMRETQRYIHQIRSSVNASNYSSPRTLQFHLKPELRLIYNKNKNSASKLPSTETQYKQDTDANVLISKPFLNDSQEDHDKELLQVPGIPKLAKHSSEVHFSRIHKDKVRKITQKSRYAKSMFKKPDDFICLPKALQANSNRMFKFLTPRLRNESVTSLHSNFYDNH